MAHAGYYGYRLPWLPYREAALLDATKQPLFSSSRPVKSGRESYPNVFDALADVKLSSSFIAGNKVSY